MKNIKNELEKIEPYFFSTKEADGQSLIHLINLFLGDGLLGAEIGIFRGTTFCTFLQQCPGIKKLYGVDNYKPYADYLKLPYDGTPAYIVDTKQAEANKLIAYHNIKFSGVSEKAVILEKDSKDALNDIQDESLDFIFMDTYMTLEQARGDLKDWYIKVKPGGLFSGHDWNCPQIQQSVIEFRQQHNIKNKLSTFDNLWVWVK